MIRIIEASREFNEVEKYLMTIAPSVTSLKDVADGTSIPVAGYLFFEDVKDNGDSAEIMSIITPDNEVYACQSATFKRSVKDIAGIMGEKPYTVIKISGKTKAGRDFINCTLDVKNL